MRSVLVLMVVCALYGGYHWWQDRDPVSAAAASENGFVPVEMPDGAARNAVLVLAPRNCPSEQARRTEALVGDLERAGIPVVRGDSFFFDVDNPTGERVAGMRRTMAVFKQGAPAVYLNGMAMSNPTSAQAIAEYRATRRGHWAGAGARAEVAE